MESIAKKTINKYLPTLKLTGKKIQVKNLPALYRGLYDFEELVINDIRFLLLSVKDKLLGPKDFKKHSRKFAEVCEYHQLWYLKELHPHKVRRMIENEMNFIIEDKHIYLPTLNLSIKSQSDKIRLSKKLTALSINILIREILQSDLSGKNKTMIAEVFKTTKMNIVRAVAPLLVSNLCEENKVGITKIVSFKTREELWNYLKQNINSPIQDVVYLSDVPQDLIYSGISALSKRSMLADDEIETAAMYKKDFNEISHKFKTVIEEDAKIKVEIWDRPPVLAEDGIINIIDCYLVLKSNKDERVQIELEKLLDKNGIRENIT